MCLPFQVQKWHLLIEKRCFVCWSMLEQGRTRLCNLHLWESSPKSYRRPCRFGYDTKCRCRRLSLQGRNRQSCRIVIRHLMKTRRNPEIQIPPTTVCRVLRRRFQLKTYKLQLVHNGRRQAKAIKLRVIKGPSLYCPSSCKP